MFIRSKTINGKRYFQVVETFREGHRVRQRSIASLGRNRTPKDAINAYQAEIASYKTEITDIGADRKSSRMAEQRCVQLEERVARLTEKIVLLKSLPDDMLTMRHRKRPR